MNAYILLILIDGILIIILRNGDQHAISQTDLSPCAHTTIVVVGWIFSTIFKTFFLKGMGPISTKEDIMTTEELKAKLGLDADSLAKLEASQMLDETVLKMATVEMLMGIGLVLGVALKVKTLYPSDTPPAAAPVSTPTGPTVITMVDPDNQCPHCQARITEDEKAANRCGSCDKKLFEEETCPYCGKHQQVKSARRCTRCRRRIPSGKEMLRRMNCMRSRRGVSAELLDAEYEAILADPVRLEELDDEIESGGGSQISHRGDYSTVY